MKILVSILIVCFSASLAFAQGERQPLPKLNISGTPLHHAGKFYYATDNYSVYEKVVKVSARPPAHYCGGIETRSYQVGLYDYQKTNLSIVITAGPEFVLDSYKAIEIAESAKTRMRDFGCDKTVIEVGFFFQGFPLDKTGQVIDLTQNGYTREVPFSEVIEEHLGRGASRTKYFNILATANDGREGTREELSTLAGVFAWADREQLETTAWQEAEQQRLTLANQRREAEYRAGVINNSERQEMLRRQRASETPEQRALREATEKQNYDRTKAYCDSHPVFDALIPAPYWCRDYATPYQPGFYDKF